MTLQDRLKKTSWQDYQESSNAFLTNPTNRLSDRRKKYPNNYFGNTDDIDLSPDNIDNTDRNKNLFDLTNVMNGTSEPTFDANAAIDSQMNDLSENDSKFQYKGTSAEADTDSGYGGLIAAGIGAAMGYLDKDTETRREEEGAIKAQRDMDKALREMSYMSPESTKQEQMANIDTGMQQAISASLSQAQGASANAGLGGSIVMPTAQVARSLPAVMAASSPYVQMRQKAIEDAQQTKLALLSRRAELAKSRGDLANESAQYVNKSGPLGKILAGASTAANIYNSMR